MLRRSLLQLLLLLLVHDSQAVAAAAARAAAAAEGGGDGDFPADYGAEVPAVSRPCALFSSATLHSFSYFSTKINNCFIYFFS